MLTKVFLLFYSKDNGDREDWSVFYTPVEVFSTAEKRDARVNELLSMTEDETEHGDVWTDEDFFTINTSLNAKWTEPND